MLTEAASNCAIAPTSGAALGHDPEVLRPEVSSVLMRALLASQCKLLLTAADGTHQEALLPLGDYGRGRAATRCFMNLECRAPELIRMLTPSQWTGHEVSRVNAYLSDADRGSPLHFDSRTVCIVQLAGTKLWITSDGPAVRDAHRNCVAELNREWVDYDGLRLQLPRRFFATVLRPGDWLLVPKATWHATFTLKGSLSASLAAPPEPAAAGIPALSVNKPASRSSN